MVAGDEREAGRLEKWAKIEGIDDRAGVVQIADKSVEIDSDSVDLALILFRMHLDDSAWILSEAKRIIGEKGRIAVFDLLDLGEDLHHEAAKNEARYYFRPYKTLLVRTVQDGGQSYYVRADHKVTIPSLYDTLRKEWDKR